MNAPSEQICTTREMPVFTSSEAERAHVKLRLAAAFRIFGKFGFSDGVAGHITARDPEHPHQFWVNPFGMHFSDIRVSDLSLVDQHGALLKGAPINPAAFAIHAAIHAARPDVVCACHAHSLYGKTWSTLNRLLDPITQDACQFYDDHAIYDDHNGIVLDLDEGARIGKALGARKAVILRNHGNVTVGRTIEEAVWWFVAMERSCEVQLLAEGTGTKPRSLPPETAKKLFRQIGAPQFGWFQGQPLFDRILKEQPDLAD